MTEPRSWLFVPADSDKKVAKALDMSRAMVCSTVTNHSEPLLPTLFSTLVIRLRRVACESTGRSAKY